MKGKLSFMWRATLALVLVLSLGVVIAVPVTADVSQPEVTLDDAAPAATAEYTIEFTTNEDLEAGDGIVIEFPEGTDISSATSPAGTPAYVDERLSIILTSDLDAGDITLVVGSVDNPPVDDDYTLKVYTSKEPTAVTSAEYMISPAVVITAVDLNPDTAATDAAYTITFNTSETVAISEDIVIEFPVNTDILDVEAGDVAVKFQGGGDPLLVDSATPVGQVLTINMGAELGIGNAHTIVIAAYITNPTTVDNPDPYDEDADNEWRLTVYTTKERVPVASVTYTLHGTLGTDVSQVAWLTVDEYVPNDAPSTAFVIQTQDEYGNEAEVEADTTFELTASSGDFYSADTCLRAEEITTIDIIIATNASETAEFFYKGATAGTVDITASESPAATPDWTDGTAQILVNPMLELWGGGAWIADYGTFEDAIDAALPFDTIKVAPSTYDGFGVSRPGITIESTAGAATTIIEGTVTISADNSVLGGASGKGFTLQEATGPQYLVNLAGGPENATISYNTFIQSRDGTHAVKAASSTTGLTVEHNDFTLPCEYGMGVFFASSSDAIELTVTYNDFTGGGSTVDNSGIELHNVDISTLDTVISHNTFTDLQNGILIGTDQAGTGLTSSADPAGTLEISNNTFDGLMYGIDMVEATDVGHIHNVVITENTFTSNTIGLGINKGACPETTDKWQPEDFTVKYNDFDGNTYAVFNNTTTTGDAAKLTAQYNWWGDVTGPSADPDPDDPDALPTAYGEGDAISALVTPYTPWLAVSQSVCVPATSSRYAIEISLTNVASYSAGTWSGGWNTFSTPIKLHGDGDTWGDITTLVNLDAAMVYGWDGTTWIAPFPSTTVITPLDAIFVQMKEEARLPILFSTQLSPATTKDLSAGWNLIGSPSLDTMQRDPALASLGTVVGLDLKYSQVIDPISGVVLEATTEMLPGQGFWVFMTADATLAGFECTPQPWVLVE